MAQDNWDDADPDFAALAGRSRRKLSVGRVWPQLLAVAGLTFAAAYYLPMHRAHRALTEQHATATEQGQSLTRDLERVRGELRASQTSHGALAARLEEIDARIKERSSQLESLEGRLDSGLSKLIKAGSVQLSSSERAVTLAIDASQVFVPGKLDVAPKGKDLLCDVARAAGDEPIHLSASAAPGELAPVAARAVLRSSRSVAAQRATTVAETLEKACRVPAARIKSVGAVSGPAKASVHFEFLPSSG